MRAPAVAVLLAIAIPAPGTEPADISIGSGGLAIRQGGNTLSLGGRIQADTVWFGGYDAAGLDDGTDVRRLRLAVKGTFEKVWKYKLEYDFADARVKDMFLTRKTGVGNFTYGQFSPPVSLENLQTSKWITFLERALPVEALVPDRELGLGYDLAGATVFLSASVTGDNVDSDDPGNEAPTALMRLVWAPAHETGRVLHFGASAGYAESASGFVTFGARPEARIDGTPRLVTLPNPATVPARGHWLGAIETAYARGPFSAQAEYIGAAVDSAAEPYFDGFYLAAGWFVNGDARSYDTGYQVFDRPAAARDSVELALRYSRLDLGDRQLGNRQSNVTAGLNYYPNPVLRFSANLIRGRLEGGAGEAAVNVVALRGQLAF